MHMLRSEFGHVYLLTTLVYLLNLLYVNYWWFGGHRSQHLFLLTIVCVYTVSASFCTARCLSFGEGSCTTERSIIIIIIVIN